MSVLKLTDLTPAYQNNINSWLNNTNIKKTCKDVSVDNLKWLIDAHKEVYEYINIPIEKVKNGAKVNIKRMDATIRANLNTLAQVLKKLDRNDLYDIYIKKMDVVIKDMQIKTENNPLEGDQLSNFVEWKNILLKRKQLKERYLKDKKKTHNNQQYLAYCLMTYIPPLRSEYADMKIIKKIEDNNNIDNFLLIIKNEYTIIINKDKVSNAKGGTELSINNNTLKSIINDSLKNYPRTYILSLQRNGNKPLGYQHFYNILVDAFENEGKKVSIDVFRKSFLTEFYSKIQEPRKERQIAQQMRHSVSTAKDTYRRWLTDEMKEAIKIELKPLGKKRKTNKNTIDRKEYMKDYNKKYHENLKNGENDEYKPNKDKIALSKILYTLKKTQKYPKDSTIKKYNLVFDKTQNRWLQEAKK
jgi:hypothetical protein